MLFPVVVVVAALAGPAVAEPPMMRFSRMANRDLLGLGRRDNDAAYAPTTTFCGVGTTCAEACGAGYDMCGKIPEQTRCYNPAAGETCCAEGLSCEKGYSCSAKGDMCLPGEALAVPSAQHAAAAVTTASAAVSTASSTEPTTTSVLSSSSLAPASSALSQLSVLSVASSSASLSHASTEECTQTTAVVVMPTPIAGNTTAVQAGPTGSSASQAIQATLTPSFSGSRAAPAPSNSTTTSAPTVVPANSANGYQGPVLAILLGAAVVPVLGL